MGKRAMVWGAVANNLPDIDVVTSLWMSQADGLLAHRGFTHSLLFALVMTPVMAYPLHRRFIHYNYRLSDWILLFGSGLFIHDFIDALTAYGTGWFEPFSHNRISLNLLFVADLLYTLPFFIGAVVLMSLGRNHPRRMFWQRFAILLNLVYLGFAVRNKLDTDNAARDAFAAQRIRPERYFTTPTPLNNLLWYVVGESRDGYHIGYRSVLDDFEVRPFRFVPRNDNLLVAFRTDPEVQKLVRFSDGYYSASVENGTTYISDLRFGQTGGWEGAEAPFVFRYALTPGADNDLVIQKGRMEAFSGESVRSLWNRMLGRTGHR
jgi:inner membrane protein